MNREGFCGSAIWWPQVTSLQVSTPISLVKIGNGAPSQEDDTVLVLAGLHFRYWEGSGNPKFQDKHVIFIRFFSLFVACKIARHPSIPSEEVFDWYVFGGVPNTKPEEVLDVKGHAFAEYFWCFFLVRDQSQSQ